MDELELQLLIGKKTGDIIMSSESVISSGVQSWSLLIESTSVLS